MIKKILKIGFISIMMLITKINVLANTYEIPNPLGEQSIIGIINRAINIMLFFAIAVGIIIIIWAGFLFITSQGDSKKAANASKVVINVLIGLAVVLLARGIIGLTYYILTGSSSSKINSPDNTINTNNPVNTSSPYVPTPDGGDFDFPSFGGFDS